MTDDDDKGNLGGDGKIPNIGACPNTRYLACTPVYRHLGCPYPASTNIDR